MVRRHSDELKFSPEELERLKRDFWQIYCAGARDAFSMAFAGPRTSDGFPADFHRWRTDWKNAWLLGFDAGFHDRWLFAEQDEARNG